MFKFKKHSHSARTLDDSELRNIEDYRQWLDVESLLLFLVGRLTEEHEERRKKVGPFTKNFLFAAAFSSAGGFLSFLSALRPAASAEVKLAGSLISLLGTILLVKESFRQLKLVRGCLRLRIIDESFMSKELIYKNAASTVLAPALREWGVDEWLKTKLTPETSEVVLALKDEFEGSFGELVELAAALESG